MNTDGVQRAACRMCAAPLPMTDVDLRRGTVVCAHCSVAQRVGPHAREPLSAPQGARVDAIGDARVYTLPRGGGAFVLQGRELKLGVIGAGVGALLGAVIGALSPVSMCLGLVVGGPVGMIVPAMLRRALPPLRATRQTLTTTSGISTELPTHDIAQLYVACVALPGGVDRFCNLWALRRDGQRVAVAGPMRDMHTALWVEQELELWLQIAERVVVGDTSAAPLHPEPPPEDAVAGDEGRCTACGDTLALDAEGARRGFVTCRSCGCVAVVQHAGPLGAARGLPSTFLTLEQDNGGLTVRDRRSGLCVRATPGRVVHGADTELRPVTITVRLQGVADVTQVLQGLVGRMAYSGTFDPTRDVAAAVGATFEVIADLGDGQRASLFSDLTDVHEAARAAAALTQAAGLSTPARSAS